MSKEVKKLIDLSTEDLLTKLDDFRRELFTLRLSSSTNHVKDNSQFKKIRKNIARSLTLLKSREQGLKEI